MAATLRDGREQLGSGYLVNGRLVLTAEHCTSDKITRKPASRLRVIRASDGAVADVAGIVRDRGLDVAVLELADGPPWDPGLAPPAFARVDQSQAGVLDDCTGIGFALFQRDPAQGARHTSEFHGSIYQTDERESGRLLMREPLIRPGPVTGPGGAAPSEPGEQGPSPWGGLSGALMFYRGRAIGVVVEHHPRQGDNALIAIGFERIAGSAKIRQCLDLPAPDGLPYVSEQATNNLYGDRHPALREHVLAVPRLLGGEVERSAEMSELVATVLSSTDGTAGVITAVIGPPGFGKTTLARMLVNRTDVREHFTGGMVWVDVGRDVTGPDLAARVNHATERLTGARPSTTDPFTAGLALGDALGKRRVLLVVDDVWTPSQLEPFRQGGVATVRLVTTRQYAVLPEGATNRVQVDAMSSRDGTLLLTRGLPRASGLLVAQLLEKTGGWAVLQSLVNGQARKRTARGQSADGALQWALGRLASAGPVGLDVKNTDQRSEAVDATLRASLDLLDEGEVERYYELAVFAKNVNIPQQVLTRYWEATAGWDLAAVEDFCTRLADLSLVAEYRLDDPPGPRLRLHDVIHDWLLAQTGRRLAGLHADLLDAHQDLVLAQSGETAWWRLPSDQAYMWTWAATHLKESGRDDELRELLHHPAYLVKKLDLDGPAGLEADLGLAADTVSRALQRVVRQNAPVLAPLEPPGSLGATLVSRLSANPVLEDVRQRLTEALSPPFLRAIGIAPDLPHGGLHRTLARHTGPLQALVSAPDGTWLASAGHDGIVRIWDPPTGAERHILTGRGRRVRALAVAPDGSWLASAEFEGIVRIWDPVAGVERHTLTGHTAMVRALAAASDGSWLASASGDHTVRIWDPVAGIEQYTLTGHTGTVRALAAASDGSWLASASDDHTVRIWDPASGVERYLLVGHAGPLYALAVAPDGSWLASAGGDGAVRIWDTADRAEQYTLTGHVGPVYALAVAPDGSWLASAGGDGAVRIWDPVPEGEPPTAPEHTDPIFAFAATPDGSWLASAGRDGTVRIWDPTTGTARHALTGHTGPVHALAAAPDGSWLASAGNDATVRIWDPATGTARHTLSRHSGPVRALTVTRAGTWLASAGDDSTVRVWDPVTGSEQHALTSHVGPGWELAVSPSGTWLACLSDDGVVTIWDPVASVKRHSLTGHSGWALTAAPDGAWLAAAGSERGSGTVRVWDPITGIERHTLRGHNGSVRALATAPDGSWLASASEDGTVRVWNPITGAERHTLTGHIAAVWALAVFPNESWLASAGDDRAVRIWDPDTGLPVAALRVADPLRGLQCTPTTVAATASNGPYWFRLELESHKHAVPIADVRDHSDVPTIGP